MTNTIEIKEVEAHSAAGTINGVEFVWGEDTNGRRRRITTTEEDFAERTHFSGKEAAAITRAVTKAWKNRPSQF